jgi:hypothetical protein
MFDQVVLGREFFEMLERQDEAITERVAAAACPVCGGPLHRGDYERKPRGGLIAPEGETSVKRFSLCCGREGCRRRATPPSLRFLGRRVYLGVVVILASIVAHALDAATEIRAATGVPARTTRRWLAWWMGPFLRTEVFVAIRARLIEVAEAALPASMLERLPGTKTEQVRLLAQLLAPLSTSAALDGSRFVRAGA